MKREKKNKEQRKEKMKKMETALVVASCGCLVSVVRLPGRPRALRSIKNMFSQERRKEIENEEKERKKVEEGR